MRAAFQRLAVWSVTLALLAGIWLPITARFDVTDADGVCGTLPVAAASSTRVDAHPAQPASGHCLVCHLRHDMAGAFVSSVVQVVLPEGSVPTLVARPTRRPNLVVIGDAPPRGPPAVS